MCQCDLRRALQLCICVEHPCESARIYLQIRDRAPPWPISSPRFPEQCPTRHARSFLVGSTHLKPQATSNLSKVRAWACFLRHMLVVRCSALQYQELITALRTNEIDLTDISIQGPLRIMNHGHSYEATQRTIEWPGCGASFREAATRKLTKAHRPETRNSKPQTAVQGKSIRRS